MLGSTHVKKARIAIGIAALAMAASASSWAATMEEAASAAYQQVRDTAKKRGALITSGDDYERIRKVSQGLIAAAPEMRADAVQWDWEVSYIRSNKQNAFCLPGGKIVVLSGLVEQLYLSDDELAAVVGHEIAHAVLEHGKESYTQRQIARVAVGILGIVAAVVGAKHNVDANAAFNAATGLGAVGAEFFALRPYGRERELEADKFGMEVAARAGFDPSGALSLQQKMGAGGSGGPEFLSTHPSSETRVQELKVSLAATLEKLASKKLAPAGAVVANVAAPETDTSAPRASPVSTTGVSSEVAALAPGNRVDAEEDPNAVVGPRAATMP